MFSRLSARARSSARARFVTLRLLRLEIHDRLVETSLKFGQETGLSLEQLQEGANQVLVHGSPPST